jgi:hypothetical protein
MLPAYAVNIKNFSAEENPQGSVEHEETYIVYGGNAGVTADIRIDFGGMYPKGGGGGRF